MSAAEGGPAWLGALQVGGAALLVSAFVALRVAAPRTVGDAEVVPPAARDAPGPGAEPPDEVATAHGAARARHRRSTPADPTDRAGLDNLAALSAEASRVDAPRPAVAPEPAPQGPHADNAPSASRGGSDDGGAALAGGAAGGAVSQVVPAPPWRLKPFVNIRMFHAKQKKLLKTTSTPIALVQGSPAVHEVEAYRCKVEVRAADVTVADGVVHGELLVCMDDVCEWSERGVVGQKAGPRGYAIDDAHNVCGVTLTLAPTGVLAPTGEVARAVADR